MPVKPLKKAAIAVSSCFLLVSLSPAQGAETPPGSAEAPAIQAPPSPKFDIAAFVVEGNTVLKEEEIKALVSPFEGKAKDFGDVQQALEALQDAYQAKGFNSVRVDLPEQELENGSVKFVVVEQKVHTITIEDNQHYSDENVMMALPSLKEGELPNIREVGKTLKIANQNPTKQTALLIKDSEAVEGAIEATVKVIDEKPWKAFVNLDNTGNRESGHGRLSFGYQNFNLFDRDHRITTQFITTPHTPGNFFNSSKEVRIFALGYTIPLYNLGDTIDLYGVYSDTTSSIPTAAGLSFGDISGKGRVYGAKYNHNLPKIKAYDHQVSLSIDNRVTKKTSIDLFVNNVFFGTQDNESITTTPLGLAYTGQWAPGDQQLSFGISGYVNLVGLAKNGDTEDFDNYSADDHFTKLTYNIDYVKILPKDWQLHIALNGQYTDDHLVAIEQFRVGGANSVRGFRESVVAGDKGHRWSIEAISHNFGKIIGDKVDLRAVVFTDHGRVSGNDDITGADNIARQSISSVGGGLRFNYGTNFSSRVEVGRVLDDDQVAGTGTREENDMFAHVSMGWQW